VEVKGNELNDLGTLRLQATKSAIELDSSPSGAQVFQAATLLGTTPLRRADLSAGDTLLVLSLEGYLPTELKASLSPKEMFKATVALSKPASIYKGTISVPVDPYSPEVPLTIKLNSDGRSGTMTQTGKRGDMVVKFNGVWEGTTLRAVTGEVISIPTGITWSPESFNLRFAPMENKATYECTATGKTYVAKLSGQTISAANPSAMYKGTIRATDDKTGPGRLLTVRLEADRKSGTMTYGSKRGDTVVKFKGVLDGTTLHAVTDEVVSKPTGIQWEPESFTLQFNSEGTGMTYECKSGGKTYVATLTP
jgi:hypothetical protein